MNLSRLGRGAEDAADDRRRQRLHLGQRRVLATIDSEDDAAYALTGALGSVQGLRGGGTTSTQSYTAFSRPLPPGSVPCEPMGRA